MYNIGHVAWVGYIVSLRHTESTMFIKNCSKTFLLPPGATRLVVIGSRKMRDNVRGVRGGYGQNVDMAPDEDLARSS